MTDNDAQLELKKRARRRLVGAIALAVLAAIVLPMVMDQEARPPVQDIQVRIPSQDAGSFTSRILPVKPGAAPTPLPIAAAKPGGTDTGTEPGAKDPPRSEPARAESPKAGAEKPESAKSEGVLTAPAKGEAKAPAAEPPTAGAGDKPAAKTAAKVVPGGGDQWVVQIGAYRDPANVRNLQAKLKEQGYNFFTEPLTTDGVTKTRVRAGPFPSREAADKARDRLKRIGVDGVVAPRQ